MSPTGSTAMEPAGGWTTRQQTRRSLAAAIVEELGRTPTSRAVETDGAARVAAHLSDLF